MGIASPWLPGPGRSMPGSGGGCRLLSARRKPRHQGSVVGCHNLPPQSVKNQLGRISDMARLRAGAARGELQAPSCTPPPRSPGQSRWCVSRTGLYSPKTHCPGTQGCPTERVPHGFMLPRCSRPRFPHLSNGLSTGPCPRDWKGLLGAELAPCCCFPLSVCVCIYINKAKKKKNPKL